MCLSAQHIISERIKSCGSRRHRSLLSGGGVCYRSGSSYCMNNVKQLGLTLSDIMIVFVMPSIDIRDTIDCPCEVYGEFREANWR